MTSTAPFANACACLEREGIRILRQLPYFSKVTLFSKGLHFGHGPPGFREAWAKSIENWDERDPQGRKLNPPGKKDRWYAETHVHEGQDILLTEDRALLAMCRRLRVENGIRIDASTPRDYVARLNSPVE
jgi:hypothetical protein